MKKQIKDTKFFIEFPSGPLGVGDAPVKKWSFNERSKEKFMNFLRLLESENE